jgi:hypothetical protein
MSKHNSVYHFDETRVDHANKEQCVHFDYDSLDEVEDNEIDPCEIVKMAEALREVLIWLCMGDINSEGYGKTVMRKAISACWVLRPEIFNGVALSEIAKAEGVNVHKQSLSKQAISFSKKFGVKGRGQRVKL